MFKGAQGAFYGRNAIGGAIVITTRQPTDEFEGRVEVGRDSGPGYRALLSGSGPLAGSKNLKYHAALSYFDTDGYIDNTYLGEKADPYKDVSARLRLLWDANDRLHTDSRLYISRLDTQALYFNIVNDVNDTSLPGSRQQCGRERPRPLAARLQARLRHGPRHADVHHLGRPNRGDSDRRRVRLPADHGIVLLQLLRLFGPATVRPESEPIPEGRHRQPGGPLHVEGRRARFNWIAGVYAITTDRFISTGNMVDTGDGVFPVYRTPSTNPLNPQFSFLADSQDNLAWAVFGDANLDLTDSSNSSWRLRYDDDHRKQTTLTPAGIPRRSTFRVSAGLHGPGAQAHVGASCSRSVTLRYQPSDAVTLYGGYSKGFRSGGFNQTGVGAVAFANGILGVHDLFDAETAETLEFGVKSRASEPTAEHGFQRLRHEATGSYFFVFLAENSTQNLGNLDKVNYSGYEFDLKALVTDSLNLNFGYGSTDSEILAAEDPTVDRQPGASRLEVHDERGHRIPSVRSAATASSSSSAPTTNESATRIGTRRTRRSASP